MDRIQTTAVDTANIGLGASGRAAQAEQGMFPLPQKPVELARWRRHDASNYDFAANLIQRQLVAAQDTLSAAHGPDWMSTRRWWSRDLAAEIARGLERDGCLFPQHYTDLQHSSFPIRTSSLQLENIAEVGYDVALLTHADMARFACSLRSYGGDIERTAEREFRLAPLVSREKLRASGFDDASLTDEALLDFSSKVHHQMAGFAPADFPQDFETAIRTVAEGKRHSLELVVS